MIIETSDNRFYQVTEPTDPALSHCYWGVEVRRKRVKHFGVTWVQTAKAARSTQADLIRKAATRIVEQ